MERVEHDDHPALRCLVNRQAALRCLVNRQERDQDAIIAGLSSSWGSGRVGAGTRG